MVGMDGDCLESNGICMGKIVSIQNIFSPLQMSKLECSFGNSGSGPITIEVNNYKQQQQISSDLLMPPTFRI